MFLKEQWTLLLLLFRDVDAHLEENGVVGVSPEVSDGIAAVAATGQYLETARALSIRARLA